MPAKNMATNDNRSYDSLGACVSLIRKNKKTSFLGTDCSYGHFVSLSFEIGHASTATVVLTVNDISNEKKTRYLKIKINDVNSIAASVDIRELATLVDIGDIIDCIATTKKGYIELQIGLGAGFIQLRGQRLNSMLEDTLDDTAANVVETAVDLQTEQKPVCFHDGNLRSIHFYASHKAHACVMMSLYQLDHSRIRSDVVLNTRKLNKFVFVADADTLQKDLLSGNISDGVFNNDASESVLKLFFRAGVLDLI
jgi:hypothetical protein